MPARRIVEPRDQADDSGLSAAGWPDNPHQLAGLDVEADVSQHFGIYGITKRHMVKNDVALDEARLDGVGLLRNDRVGVEDCANAIHANRGLRNRIGGSGKVLDRLEELAQVRQINRERADRHRSGEDERGPAPQHHGGT